MTAAGCVVTVPRETEEFLPLLVVYDGTPITNYETAIVKGCDRPTTWVAAATEGLYTGVVLDGLSKGEWHVFVRVDGTVVDEVSTIKVT